MRRPLLLLLGFLLLVPPLFAQTWQRLPGMKFAGRVTRDANGIAHIQAFTDFDAAFLNGWVHAQDRLFEMDENRRVASGTFAELVGTAAVPTDVQLRTLGLRRAAQLSQLEYSRDVTEILDAYSAGVNAYVAANGLSPEYRALEITRWEPWTPLDSIAVAKLLAFGLSFDLDVDNTVALLTYRGAGQQLGFNGSVLFFEDLFRSAPFDPASTVPDATKGTSIPPPPENVAANIEQWEAFARAADSLNPTAVELFQNYAEDLRSTPFFRKLLDPELRGASNEWAISRTLSATGNSVMANDPHLSLRMPSIFYPLVIRGARINAAGVGFPGAPLIVQGHNDRIAWGSTVNPMDVTDAYQEQLVPDATSTSGFAVLYKGARESLTAIPQAFRVNVVGNGTNDDLNIVPPSALIPAGTLIVNRRGAPIVSLDATTGAAVSIQWVGMGPTRELETFLIWNKATGLDDFRRGLEFFDVGSQNWIYTDVAGNIAYFTSGEMPIREDLQAGTVAGLPPFFLRNGSGGGNDWIRDTTRTPTQASSFEIFPQSEMPSIVNPAGGWIVNANNDPAGTTLDNNALNQLRPGGGIFYLNPGYSGFRAGRITQMVRAKLAKNEKFSVADMQAMQADVVLLDAQYFVPHITAALENGQHSTFPPLAQLAASPAVVAAVNLLKTWDFSTPTGIAEGYDAADANGALSAPSQAEIGNSVAATIYSVWRGQILKNTIDAVLGVGNLPRPSSALAVTALRNLLDNYATRGGAGASGVPFFNIPGVPNNAETAASRRDTIILKSVADALALVSGDEFAPAFAKSANLSDYRWGKLHRIVFAHPLGGPLNTPPAGGVFPAPLTGLTGIPVDGGFEVVDASNHNSRAATLNGFMFSSGPARRNVSEATTTGIRAFMALPGGSSGIVGNPLYINLLKPYLTNDYFSIGVQTGPTLPWGVK